MPDRWAYPVAQAMQRHTGCRYVKPIIAPPTVPEETPAPEIVVVSPPLAETETPTEH